MLLIVPKGSDWRGCRWVSSTLLCILMSQYFELPMVSELHESFKHGHQKGLDILKSLSQAKSLDNALTSANVPSFEWFYLFVCYFTDSFLNNWKILPSRKVWLIFNIVQEMHWIVWQLTLCASFIMFSRTEMPSALVYNTSVTIPSAFYQEASGRKIIFEINTAN